MAWRWDIVWPDTVAYFSAAEALEQNDPGPMLHEFGPNFYVALLALLHRAGTDWETAGMCWSVLAASLAVLPLFGWLRRQFDDRVALLGGLLYALHPRLMNDSPLIIRDSTFWLLFNLTLYLGWRAATEMRWPFFAAAGAAWALAIHTRAEGWLLVVPLALWLAMRWRFAAGQRLRLAAGALLCLSMPPAAVAVVNLVLLPEMEACGDSPGERGAWQVPGAQYVKRLPKSSIVGSVAKAATADVPLAVPSKPPPPPPVMRTVPMSPLTTTWKMAVRLVKAYTYVFGLLLLIGMWKGRRTLFHGDQMAVAVLNLLLWALIWFRYWQGLGIDIRYFLPSVCMGMGYMALGLMSVAEWLIRRTSSRVEWTSLRRNALVCGLLAVVLLAGTPDRSLASREFMYRHADLGQWIHENLGPHRRLLGCVPEGRLVLYYARADGYEQYRPWDGDSLERLIAEKKPDVVLLWDYGKDHRDTEAWKAVLAAHAEFGLERIPPEQLPETCRNAEELLVLVCRNPTRP